MAADQFFDCDKAELYKGSVHMAMFGLASVCAAYSAGACCVRPSPKLISNVLLYSSLAAYETLQVWRHWHEVR